MPRGTNRANAFQQAPSGGSFEVAARLLTIGFDRGQIANTDVWPTAAFA
jgi:hypothetical protein